MDNSQSINTNGEGITQSSPSFTMTFGSFAPVRFDLGKPPRRSFGTTQAENVEANPLEASLPVVTENSQKAEDASVQANPSLPPPSSLGRMIRKRVLWTLEEEEMLREGVEASLDEIVKNMSWKRIWEMGRHVFHPTRTPDNLKDKWNRMNRAANN